MENRAPLTDERALELLTSKDGHGFTKTQIAAFLGKTKQAISKWETIPAKYVTVISQKTGVPKAQLRPSDFA